VKVEVNGVRLFFEVVGEKMELHGTQLVEKPTLLILHGGPGFDHHGMRPYFDRFSDVAQVIYYDHRGNGQSERGPLESLNLWQWGDDVKAFCDVLGVQSPIVLGHSFGGFVAESYMTRHPEHPAKVILSSTQGRSGKDESFATYQRLGGAPAEQAARAAFTDQSLENMLEFQRVCRPLYHRTEGHGLPTRPGIFTAETLLYFWRDHVEVSDGAWRDFSFLEALASTQCPVLILGGDDDPACPLSFQEELAAVIPPALVSFHHFANCGHGTYFDCPEETERVLRDFLVESTHPAQ